MKLIGGMSLRVMPASVGTKKLVGDAITAISTMLKGMGVSVETRKQIGVAKIVTEMWPRDMLALNVTTNKRTGIARSAVG